jgi:hypothetical protein
MADAKAPDHQEADQQHHHPHRAVVAIERGISEQNADPTGKIDGDQEAPEQLQTSVGRDLLVREHDRKIALDAGPNPVST